MAKNVSTLCTNTVYMLHRMTKTRYTSFTFDKKKCVEPCRFDQYLPILQVSGQRVIVEQFQLYHGETKFHFDEILSLY
jgi:hypothetical protein